MIFNRSLFLTLCLVFAGQLCLGQSTSVEKAASAYSNVLKINVHEIPVPEVAISQPGRGEAAPSGIIRLTNLPTGFWSRLDGGLPTKDKEIYAGLAPGTYAVTIGGYDCEQTIFVTIYGPETDIAVSLFDFDFIRG